MNDNKRKLYDALSNDYDMGTYEQFRKDLEDKDKRRKLYDATSDAYDFGDYDQFEAQLGYGQSPSAPGAEEINSGSAGPVMPKPAMENRNWEVQMGNGHSRATVEKPEPVDVPIPQRPEGQEPSDDGTAAPSGDVRSYLEYANRQQVANLSRDISSRLDEAQTKSRDIYMKEQEDARKGGFLSTLAHAIAASGHNPEGRSGGMSDAQQRTLQGANSELQSEISKLEAAKKAMSNAEEIIAEADKSVQEGEFPGFFKGIARGFGDKLFDVNTWDMGVSDTKNSIELLKALRKYDEGKPLSESEQMLLDAKSVELATNAYFGSYIGRGYKAGAVTAQSLPFMLEMAVNPASTLGESTQSMLARYALSRFAKKGAARAAQKFATKAAGAAGRALGDIAGSAVMAGTSGAVRVAGDAIDRYAGDIETDMDGQGQTVFAGHDPESLGKSIAKAFTSTAIENHSEMLGEYFAPALGIVSKLGRKGMEKFGLKKVVDFVDDVSATDAAKLIADFQKRTKWNGTIGEYAEEVAGNIENAILVGDNTLDASDDTGVFNLDQNIDTFLGVALMGGVFSAVRTAMWRTPKYRARMEMEKARDEARTKYGSEAWQEIEDRMAEAGDSGMSAVLSTVIAGENSPEKAKALLDYAKSIKKYEGMLTGDEKRREIASPEATDLETSYENGYTLSTPQEVHDAKLMFEYQEAMLQKVLGTSDIDIDTIMLGNEMGTLTDEQKSVAMDYLNAKATFDGVIDRVRDDLDSRISSVENAIDASTNRDTGMLQPASLVDDRPVHIISGIVRLTPDGTMVDTRNSENFIIVRDDRTGRMETISPSDINRLENEIDPAMEKQAARQQIQDVYGSREADSIDGVLAFNPGDTYTLTNGQGQSFPVQIVANEQGATDNGDGTVNVILNNDIDTQTGQPRITQMPKEQIQEMAEATNLSRLQQYEQQKLAMAAEQAETDATGRTPENPFRINDRITLSDAETGNVENGVVGSELTDDGKYEVVVEKQDGSQSILYLSPSELEQLGARLEQPEAVEEQNSPVLEQNQPVLEQKTEKSEQESAMSRIPLDRDGVPQFEQAQPSDTWDALLELNSGNAVEAEDTARQMYENASKNLDKAQKTKPKSGTSVMEIQRNKAERNGQIDELRKSVDFWGKVLSFPEAVRKSASAAAEAEVRQKEDAKREAVRQAKENLAKGRKLMQQKGTYYKDDAKLGDYLDFHDYALRMIANGRVKFVWKNDADNNSIKGLGGHLGLEDSESERKALFSLLANQDKGGLRPDDAAEQLSEEYNSSLGAEVISSSEALDVILDIIRTYGGKTRDMMNAAIDAHAMAGMDERGHDEDNKSSEDKDNSKIAEGQESLPADAPLSNEMNEFGVPFIESSDGTTVFGVLTDDSGLSPAPIKLSLGENATDKNGTNHGYGLLHIEAGHGDQIRAAGYDSIEKFVEDVARNYDTIREGGIVANNQTYLLELSDEHNNTLFIQLSRDGSYWNINSAGIFKKKYSRRKPEVFTRPALKTETDTDSGRVDSSRFNGATAPAGNSHQTSEGKDTNISEESNTGSEKSVAEQITEQREVVNTEPTEAQKEKPVQGLEGYSREEIKGIVTDHINDVMRDYDIDAEIIGMDIHGSRNRHDARPDSDLDVVVEYSGDIREDDMFNALNGEEDALSIEGIKVDINPIRKEETGDLQDYMKQSEEYDREKSSADNQGNPVNEDSTPAGRAVKEEEKPAEVSAPAETETPKNEGAFGLVSDDRMAELKERLRKKLSGQLNMGIDPEILAIGMELAVGHIDRGVKTFADFSKKMIEDLGDVIRPYLKAFYNGARDLPEVIESGLSAEMTPYDEVRRFNVATIGENGEEKKPTILETAEQVSNELTVQRNADEVEVVVSETENTTNDVYSIAPAQYTTKRGKVLDMFLVKPNDELGTSEQRAANARVREMKGWWDKKAGGFMLRSEEDARQFVEQTFRNPIGTTASANEVQAAKTSLMSDTGSSRDEQEVNAAVGKTFKSKKGLILYVDRIDDGRVFYEITDIDGTTERYDTSIPAMADALQRWEEVTVTDNNNNNETDRTAAEQAAENKQPKNSTKKKKSVSLHTEVADLFSGLFDEETLNSKDNENGLQRNDAVRSEGLSADGGKHTERLSEGSEKDSGSEPQERSGLNAGRKGTGVEADRSVRPRLSDTVEELAPSEHKNTHNNHSERGENHAPTSIDARIEANIKAIELAQQLIDSGEQATEKQMQVLRKFSGWGGLGKAFSDSLYSVQLQNILGAEAYQDAVMSANSAYYTPAYIVDTLWDIAEQLGFKGGNILEGSAGIGNILGQMPINISERSDIHAIEIDGTSGNILSLLYPDAKVDIQGFEQTRIPNGSVDLAITNVPFVTGLRVNDTTGDKDLSKKFHNIHDFCIAKNVRKLREGGLGIFITSNGTLDNSKQLRDWIVSEGGADFIGAFRMNNKTFGGTGVTSDIIVIRKRMNGRKSSNAIDVSTITGERSVEYDTGDTRKVKGQTVPVIKHLAMDYNRYFVEHPENMAGVMQFAFEQGDKFRPTAKGLYPEKGKNQERMLSDFVSSFKEETDTPAASDESNRTDNGYVSDASADGRKLGELYVKDSKLVVAGIGGYSPLAVNDNKVKGHTKVECFKAYAAIKDALAEVLKYQTENESDSGLKPLLAKLNKAYDDFVSTYGHFNKNTAISFLHNDVDYANVFSLEKYEETGDKSGKRVQKFDKADVFSQRVVEKEKEPNPTNVKDGIIASVFKFGRIDVPYIANQLGRSVEDVKKEIISSGYGFEDPTTKQMELSYQYLSGNVREKLRQAEANNDNGEYDGNIKALQKVIPMDIPAHLIDFTLGSSWITPKLYEDYIKDRTDIDVKLTAAGGSWFMDTPYYVNNEKNRSMGVYSEVLHTTVLGHTLIEAAIQNKTITVSRTSKKWDGTTETITDKDATQACAAKIDEIRQDFKDWARQKMQSDSEMSDEMERIYNDTFNNYVPMSIPDEFVPEYFGGASHKFKMRPHQGKAIVRGTMQPLLLAHEVGTGKTFTLISTAMEMRRLGTARKPMIVVQNATVGQFVASAKELYPNAKILTLEEADRTADGRKNFYAKIRHNDWDMIVVPQSTFEFIPDSEERQMQFVQDKIEEKKAVLENMQDADPRGESMITRQAKKEISDLEAQLAELSESASKKRSASAEKKRAVTLQNAEVKALEMLDRRTDDVENFDDMGIDALLIDEAHEYKHLGFATAMQRGVKGVDSSYSKKSQGVYLKTQAVLENNNGRNVIFATGTPISNTAAEIWTFMRYLMPADTMKEYGIYYFDDFVRNFGNIQQMLEFNTNGKFKESNRFAGYVNLPELVRIWSGISDTVLTKEAGDVKDKIPDIEGGKAQDLYLPQTKALRSIMKFVKSELQRYEQMSGREKKENSHIPLTMYGIAKSAAVDARLVSDAEDDPNSKTNEAVRQTLRSLKETASYKGTVAIFSDNYQNKKTGFNLYDDIRNKLIAQGVPDDEVVVIRPGMTMKKKLEIFDKVNRGEIRVILGSTYTLGTGVNIQERLHTLIHLDAPNRPMDYTQRNGRILRQGNLHKAMGKPVRILRFGVEDSLDVTAYQRLKTKGAIADSIMNGKQMMANNMTNRVLEEEEDVFGDTIAQLSGSEYAMLKNNAEKNVRKFESRKKQWEADQTYIHNAKPKLKAQIAEAEKRAETNRKFRKAVEQAFPGGKFDSITAGKQTFSTAEEMADFFKEHNKVILDKMKQMKEGGDDSHTRELTVRIGDYSFKVRTVLKKDIGRNGGQLFSEVRRQMTYSCPELGLEDVPVYQNLLRNAIDDIVQNVITGKNYAERVEKAEADVKHYQSELKQVESREGVPFEYAAELEQARNQYEEYSELMKKEMEEKEAKYAEMDKDVEAASDISTSEEDDDDDLMRASDTMYRIRESAAPTIGVGLDVEAAAERLAESLGERVRIVRDVNEIENQNKNVQESQRKSKGWFNTRTGEIVVVLPNATGIEDVQATILHEAVGHKGLRELVGNDRFDDFLDKVYAAATKATRLEIVSLARRNHWDFRLATEEYIAGLAEKGFSGRENRTLFGKIKDFFLDMLSRAKIALGFNIGDNELRYMLWRTYQMRTSRGILAKANDMAVQQELKVGNFREDNSSPVSFLKQMQDNAETLVPRQLTKEIWDNEIKGKVFSTPIGVVKLGENQYEKNIKKGRELEFGMLIPTIERPDAIFEEDAPEAGAERQTKYVFVKSFVENGVKKINYASVSVRKDGMEVVASSHYLRDKQMLNKIEKERMLWNRFASGSELSAQGGSTAQSNALSLDANLLKGVKKTNSDEEILSGDDSRLRFRTSGNDGSSNTARDIYEEKTRVIDKNGRKSDTANLMRRLKEAYVDSMQSLKYLQDAISEETGKPVEDFENAYLAENSMSSKNKAQTDIYLNRFFNPIKDAIRDLQKEGAEYGDIVRYLMAKHGLERNEVFSKRDAEKDGGVWDGSVRRDYSGLTELTRRETDTVAPRIDEITSRAEDIVRKFEMDHDTDVLWEKINAATKDTLRTSYVTGMLTKDNYEMVRSMFRYYIPLRGWSENTASAVYDYLSDARPKTSSIVKAATGRTTISDDPIATIAYMGQSAIIQGNRNLMKQKLLNLALNHKTGLLTVSRQWEVLDPVTGMWTPRDPDIPADAAPEQVADIVADFEKNMKDAEKKGVARLSRGKLDTGKHLTAYEGQEHIIKVKRGGIDYSIYLNGNPRAAQAVNGMTNPDAVDSWLIRKARVIKNFMARMFTSQNPAFIISNLSRDVIFAGTAVYAKEDAKYAARYAKNITVALAKGQLIGLIHRFETDRLDNSKDLDRYFGEFIRNGGETGFTQLNTVDDFKRDIDRFAREMKQGQVMKVSTKVWNGIEYMNRCAEDATRFSVYMTSRQMGRSVERSISDAKEITVNFNRKGSGGFGARLMNFAYIFFNAAVQSLANAGKIMYEHPMKALAALGTFSAAGFMAPLLAQAIISAFGGDDDAYWDLPEWVRRNNFVFYIPWSENKFLIIPISQELRPFYAMGEIAMSVLMGKEEVLDGLKSAAGSFMDLLPIDFMGNGGNLAISLTPTVAQPLAQLVANTDYFGSPIYRRNDYNKLDPAWTKAYKGTSPMLVNASKWLNEVTGGDDVKRGWIDPINNPAVIEHLFESYLGGTGKTINRAAKTFSMIWNPDMRDIRNVPIASTFIQESDDERVAGNQLNREYFKLMDEFKETSHTVSGYKKKARMGSMEYADKLNEFMETPDFERYSKARGYANTISKLRQALKRAQESGEDVMVEENLQQILHDLKRQMVEELKEQ